MAMDPFGKPERVEDVEFGGRRCRVRKALAGFAFGCVGLGLAGVLYAERSREAMPATPVAAKLLTASAPRPSAQQPIVSGEVASLTIWANPVGSTHSNTGTDIAQRYPGSRIDVYENFLVVNTPEDGRIVSPNGSYSNLKLKPESRPPEVWPMLLRSTLAALFALAILTEARAEDPPTSFMKDVAPILVKSCIACHNPKKAESKYVMTTFAQLAKGGEQGEDVTLIGGDPDNSRFVELIRVNGEPRMPYKQDPMKAAEIAAIERWVKQGAKYDGAAPNEDWVALLHKTAPVNIPESYPAPMPITALAFSPDDADVASSGYHEMNVWKREDGVMSRRIRGLSERVYDVAYSPDGKWLATASGDPGQLGVAKLWLAEPDGGGKPVRDLVESTDSIFAVAFSPDSKLVAAAGADRAVRVWEVESGTLVATIEDHADWVLDVAFSPDSKRIASASRDKTAKVYDLVKKESVATFPGHNEAVYTVSFTPDGKRVASGGGDGKIRIWGPDEDGRQSAAFGDFGGPVFKLIQHPDGKQIVACSADKTVRIFSGNAPRHTLSGHRDWVYSLAVSRDGKSIASGSWDGEIRLWDVESGKPVRTILAAPGLKVAAEAK